MSLAVQALATLLPVLYLATALLYGMELAGPRAPRASVLRGSFCVATLIAHAAYIRCLWLLLDHFPASNAWTAISLLAFAILLVYFPVERLTRTAATGIFVLGSAFVLQLLASAFAPREPEPSPLAGSAFFVVHVSSALCAVAALLLSGFYGALYLLLFRQIRTRRFGLLFNKLPDLERLSRLNRGAATVGFVLLTAGINIGIWWAHAGGVANFSYSDPKVLPLLVIWLVFGVIGLSRWVRLLSGRRAAQIAVFAATALVLIVAVSFGPFGSFGSFHVFR